MEGELLAELGRVIECAVRRGFESLRAEPPARGVQASRSRDLQLALKPVSVDLSAIAAGTSPSKICGAGECFFIESGGFPTVELHFELEGSGSYVTRALTGEPFRFPFKSVSLLVPAGVTHTLRAFVGPAGAADPPAASPLFDLASGVGRAMHGFWDGTHSHLRTRDSALSVASGQTIVTAAAAVQIVGARAGRRAVLLSRITETQDVYLGGAAVAVGTGFRWDPLDPPVLDLPFEGALFGRANAADQTVSYLELY